jgi:hypothetical protein
VTPRAERFLLWLALAVLGGGAVHALLFSFVPDLQQLWLVAIRNPRSPLADLGVFLGTQVLALVWLLAGRGAGPGVGRRAMYSIGAAASFYGCWFFLRMEDLLVPLGISAGLMILTLIGLRK